MLMQSVHFERTIAGMDSGNRDASRRLGELIRAARTRQGLTTYQVAERAGFNQSFVTRIEGGIHQNPDTAKVSAIADILGVDVSELMAQAGYPLPAEDLTPTLYLRAKYRNLPADQLNALQRDVARVLQHHGIDPSDGPAPGEDEQPPTKKKSSTKKKGGTP